MIHAGIFIPWEQTSLSRSYHQLSSLLQDDLGRELLFHHLFFAYFLVCGFGLRGRYNIFLFLPRPEQIIVLKHNPGVVLFQCDTQLVFEQLETKKTAPSGIYIPINGPTLAPQPCKDSANTAGQNIEQLIVLYTITLPITSFTHSSVGF